MKKNICAFLLLTLLGVEFCMAQPAKIKVAAVGASITYGYGTANRQTDAFPARLQTLLGDKYEVHNYGVNGSTMLMKGDLPYNKTKEFQQALALNPDIVLIDLGGNDSKLINRIYTDDLEKDCRFFIETFSKLNSHPRIIILLPIVSFVKDSTGIYDPVIVNTIIPHLQQVAYSSGVEVINMHPVLVNHPELMPDKIHPNTQGSYLMARKVYQVVAHQTDSSFNIYSSLPNPNKISSFYGYNCVEFSVANHLCKVVQPKTAATNHPWIWRARFWGHEPQTDIALLEQGFHLVYCDVAEMLGNEECIGIWNQFYAILHHAGLSEKAVMEGMSRGGTYVFDWAVVNSNKIAGVYVDNPLLNIRDWALKMDSVNAGDDMLKDFKKDYNIQSREQMLQFKNNPVDKDKIKKIVKGHYPILVLCADADEAVSPAENTLLFEQRIKKQGGNITVIHKPGFKHHPHSFPNPEPIVDFILQATGKNL